MKRVSSRLLIAFIILLIVPLFLPVYYTHILILTFFFAFMAQAWSILADAGQISMGHSVFTGLGGYVSTLLYIHYGLTPWVGMILAGVLATLVGLFIGYLCFRYGVRELYFILVTLAFGQIFVFLAINLEFVGGPNGLSVPVEPGWVNYQFVHKYAYYYVIFFLFTGVMLLRHAFHTRKLGHYFAAIRENEDAAQALGIHLMKYKLIALGISAFVTSLGGTFYVQYISFIEPESFLGPNMALLAIVCVIVGGLGTLWGPSIGAFFLIPLGELMRIILHGKFPSVPLMVHGIVLILVIIFLPRGIIALGRRIPTLRISRS